MDIELIDNILKTYRTDLGSHYYKYRNHVCRVYVFATILSNANEQEQKQIAIASAFHDIGIWSASTFDYLQPSIELAEKYLIENKLEHWTKIVTEIISNHHKIKPYKHNHLVESFRKADLTDLTFGLIKFGITRKQISEYKKLYPAKGFQTYIFKEILKNIVRHPLNPLPIIKW
jgi:hypothetical protein